jgi:thiosulfate dehydrogenase
MNSKDPFIWILIALTSLMTFLLALPYVKDYYDYAMEDPTQRAFQNKLERDSEVYSDLQFDLSDPEDSPESIHELVLQGFGLMVNTQRLAKNYIDSSLNCTNCHFAAGNTSGGQNGGISLAGVSAVYPKYEEKFDLPHRINNCFRRSMNGRPLPLDSKEMLALITYFQWISKGLPVYQEVPWLGYKSLEITTEPNIEHGKKIYGTYCALCHGNNGEGTPHYPPVWGDKSFNNEAGSNTQPKLESFIHNNMPYNDPKLSQQESRDVAAYLRSQPRPIYQNN